jgi:internalin A
MCLLTSKYRAVMIFCALNLKNHHIFPTMNFIEARGIIERTINEGTDQLNLSSISEDEKLNDADLRKLLPYLLKMRSLTSLDLYNNQIDDGKILSKLKSLTTLNLSANRITDCSFLGELRSLAWLNLENNQISDADVIGELKLLKGLYVNGNRLSDVSFVRELKSLNHLHVSGNDISDASFVADLKSLRTLHIDNNPKLDLPKKLLAIKQLDRENIEEIAAYYKQLEAGEDYIYEAKVLIVGEPKAGKTTLFRKLQDPLYLPQEATPEEKESTIGVQIEVLEFPFDNENTFKAHLWDFGGQEKQYVLHQYFFTERSLYILLADDRKELGNFNYWFEIIATLGSGCPVLVVLNEINAKVKNFDLSAYRREFGEKIQDIEEKSVNFADADGRFNNLETEIKRKLKNLEHIGKPLPKTWVDIRRELQEISEPVINIDDYYSICERNGVQNPDYRKQILEYLHDLGIALNYKYDDNLRNKLILKPNWVIDALYAVLKDEKIVKNAGKFTSDEVFELWRDYRSDERTILLQLMQKGKFEVAYKLANKNAYIAPILLVEIAPAYHFEEKDSLSIHFEYTFKPKGIISRLIVRFHENIVTRAGEQIVWKKGVLLINNNSFARIVESEQSRKITVTVSGPNPIENRTLLTIISVEIKRIHHDWFEDRLKYEEKIPCICEVCKTDGAEPHFYDVGEVESYYEISMNLTCLASVKARNPRNVIPRQLLEGVYIVKEKEDFEGRSGGIFVNGDLYMGLTQITLRERVVDEVSHRMNASQKIEMKTLADEIIARIESREMARLNEAEQKELEKAKKGKWETKIKFVIPLIPKIPFLENFLPSAGLETTRTVTPDEYISTVRRGLYGDDLPVSILETGNI